MEIKKFIINLDQYFISILQIGINVTRNEYVED